MSWRKRWWAEGQRVSCGRWGSALRQGIRTKKESACSVLASAPLPGVNRWVLETQRSQAWIPAWTQIIITRGKGTRLTWGKEHGVLEPRRGAGQRLQKALLCKLSTHWATMWKPWLCPGVQPVGVSYIRFWQRPFYRYKPEPFCWLHSRGPGKRGPLEVREAAGNAWGKSRPGPHLPYQLLP